VLEDGAGRALDVGCGTGIVARLLAARGCDVLGVEPDARMAAVARRHGIVVEAGTFEGWDPRGRTFDVLVAGQSWHWVDPRRGAEKAASVLRPGGRVGLFWNQGTLDPAVKPAIDAVYRRVAPALASSIVLGVLASDRLTVAADALDATGDFDPTVTRVYGHERTYRTAEWLDHVPTHSDHRTLDPATLRTLLAEMGAALDEVGGALRVDYTTRAVLTRRRAVSSRAAR
jgi:SAM-dependent methyltransferase